MSEQLRRILFTADARFAVSRAEGKPVTLSGYALVWNVLSEDRGGYQVRLRQGSAKFRTPTLALYHHDSRQILGNTRNGTLRIFPDSYGVKVEIDLPDTSVGRDVAVLVERGDIAGMSFAMATAPEGKSITEDGKTIFEAASFEVDEVTVTAWPAFAEATVGKKQEQGPRIAAARNRQSLQLDRLRLETMSLPGVPGASS